MDESTPILDERRLRQQLQRFLSGPGQRGVAAALKDWHKKGWQPYLFGGLLRDVLLFGQRQQPRDIDVVMINGTSEELAASLEPHILKRNRFGGFQLELSRWHFDVWPLHKTWAFVQDTNLRASPENLPRTTFLNVEAVVVSVGENGSLGSVFECGFFKGVQTRTLDINLEDNPYPSLAAVRALATATKLGFLLSPRLARYIIGQEASAGSGALVAAQEAHYGYVRFREHDIQLLVEQLKRGLDRDPDAPLSLPNANIQQLSLW